MDWFPSLICKNYIFKHFVKTVEPTSLKFCTIIELITLHLEYTIAQVKYASSIVLEGSSAKFTKN